MQECWAASGVVAPLAAREQTLGREVVVSFSGSVRDGLPVRALLSFGVRGGFGVG